MINPLKKNVPLALFAAALGLLAFGCAETNADSTADTALTAKVKQAFAADPTVNSFDLNVLTYNGVVQLSGPVHTRDQKMAADRDAQSVSGVTSVEDNIEVE